MKRSVRAFTIVAGAVGLLLSPRLLSAHPMGNFSISHYTRLAWENGRVTGRYVLDMAEIPTVSEQERLDANHDGSVSSEERIAYLSAQCLALRQNLVLAVNGQPIPLDAQPEDMALRAGAGGLPTLRLTLRLSASLPACAPNAPCLVTYMDNNYPNRTGWKEIVVQSAPGRVRECSVSSLDISKELTVYPTDPGIAPPQDTQARFTIIGTPVKAPQNVSAASPNAAPSDSSSSNAAVPASNLPSSSASNTPPVVKQTEIQTRQVPRQNTGTPQDRFTQSIATANLTPALMLIALASAFGFGAVHALSPGHGKAMVAAYLVGTRGTVWHAVLLGLVVTLTHTLGVFALGLITLFASQRIVPEKLFPIISAISGALVALMGIGLLAGRWQAWRNAEGEDRGRGEEEKRRRGEEEKASVGIGDGVRDGDETEEFYNQRRAGGEVSLRALIGLGITGGALPCPSALVVMLSAIALHRIAFGLLLIVCFSLGLAVVLTLLGLLMMRARNLLERFPTRGRLIAGVSVLSAGVVTVIGLALMCSALSGKF